MFLLLTEYWAVLYSIEHERVSTHGNVTCRGNVCVNYTLFTVHTNTLHCVMKPCIPAARIKALKQCGVSPPPTTTPVGRESMRWLVLRRVHGDGGKRQTHLGGRLCFPCLAHHHKTVSLSVGPEITRTQPNLQKWLHVFEHSIKSCRHDPTNMNKQCVIRMQLTFS